MSAPTIVQSGQAISLYNSTNTAVTLTGCVAGNTLLALIGTFDNNPANLTYSDSQSNSYTVKGSFYNIGVNSYGLRAMVAQVGSTGNITFTANKLGSTFVCGVQLYELNGVVSPYAEFDLNAVQGTNTDSSVTMSSSTTVNADLLFTILGTRETGQVTPNSPNTTNASFVNNLNQSSAGGLQMQTAVATTSTNAAFTGGWPAMTNAAARPWSSGIIAMKGASSSPTISSLSGTSAVEGGSLTITGTNLKASGDSTVTLGGIAQTVTAQSSTTPVITTVLGTSLFGVSLGTILTTSTPETSNTYALSGGLTPPSGYDYVTIGTPNTTSDYRITAVGDIATGNQLEWDQASLVTVYNDGTFVADPSVSSFQVRVGVSGDGWGAWATQSISQSSGDSGAVYNVGMFGIGMGLNG